MHGSVKSGRNLRRYPGDYVLDFIDGEGREFDYGVDYLECASCKFLKAEGEFYLAEYLCAVGRSASELLGWGLARTMPLAGGSERCDFRFKQGGETQVDVPQSFQALI